MRIAIIGAGVSGLVAASQLHQKHDITLFEAGDSPGGHVRTINVEIDGASFDIDTGFVVFNNVRYPEFLRIIRRLGVETQLSDMSFSVSCNKTGIEYAGTSVNGLFAQRRNIMRPTFLRLLADYLRFNRRARDGLNFDERETLGEFLDRSDFSRVFRDLYLVPMGAAIWSAVDRQIELMPVNTFVRFFDNHGLLRVWNRPQWRSIRGGSRRYVEALIQPFRDRIHLQTPATRVWRDRAGAHITLEGHGETTYDHVVFATHSDQALRILDDPTPDERRVLGAIGFQENDVVVHTDRTLLPRNRRAWAAWNYRIPESNGDRVQITYNMNRLQCLAAPQTFCVTLNQTEHINPARVITQLTYHHPVLNQDAIRAQKHWPRISGRRSTSYAGAYWNYGFHEDGVLSGIRVAQELRHFE